MKKGDLVLLDKRYCIPGELKPTVAIYLFDRNLRKDLDEWKGQYWDWNHVVLIADTLQTRLVLSEEIEALTC